MIEAATTESSASRRAVACLLAGAVMISFSGVWVKTSHVGPTVSAFYRVFFGSLFLLAGALWRREIRRLSARQNGLILVCGGFFALDLILYHYSIQTVGPGLGTILPNFQVFLMALSGGLFFGERLGAVYWSSIPLAFGGLTLVVGVNWPALDRIYKLGVYAGLATSLCYTGFLLSLRRLQADERNLSFFNVLLMVSLTATLLLGLEMAATGTAFSLPDLRSVLSLSALGLFSQCAGWMIIATALPKVRVSLSGLVLLLQPALAFVWDVVLFRRPTGASNWIGVLVVLAAIYMGSAGKSRRSTETTSE
jgi:drug/metabolite transporter (DMT)-like permease